MSRFQRADSAGSGAPTDDVAIGPSGAAPGGSRAGAAPGRPANSGNPAAVRRGTLRGSVVAAASVPSARPSRPSRPSGEHASVAPADPAAVPLSARSFPPWRLSLELGRIEIFLFVGKLRLRSQAGVDLARRQEKVCSFLRHLDRDYDGPIQALTQYVNRVNQALEHLTSEANRAYVPTEIAEWAAAIYDKFERDNWGVAAGNNDNTAATITTATTAAGNNNIIASATQPAPAAAPAPAAPANQIANAANGPSPDRLPPANHPIWGVNGIMHGLFLKPVRGRRQYGFDKRYRHEKKRADRFGHNNLTPGAWWPLQIVSLYHGAHGSPIKGIFGNPTDGAYSIVISGQSKTYHGLDKDEGYTIEYSADSPKGDNGHTDNASLQSAETRALRTSIRTRQPVRVLRSATGKNDKKTVRPWAPSVGIRYDGLYRVEGEFRKAKGDTPGSGTVVLFRLKRMDDQVPLEEIRDSVPSAEQIRDEGRIRDGY